jgi:pimeloyl-ACP methyl ester carboxylesterase
MPRQAQLQEASAAALPPSAGRRFGWGWLIVLAVPLAGGCASTLPDRAARMQRAYVYYLDGAGGGAALRNWGGGVRQGLLDAGYDGAGEMFSWETGLGMLVDQVASVEYKRQKAGELALRIADLARTLPDTPVYLIGLSAGTAIAVFTLEALPDDLMIENAILLSGSLSADYDVTRALHHVRHKMYVFSSRRDGLLLFLEPMFGSADRQRGSTGVIGVRGLYPPAGASAETRRQYAKVVNIPWQPAFAQQGEFGLHADPVKAPFVQKYLAPLVMENRAPGIAAAATDTIENPDYTRWARFGVGSTATFEGYQVLDGVRQPLRLTVTLVAKYAGSLLVERQFAALRGQEPRVRQFFVPARVKAAEHPLTHPQTTVGDGPHELVPVDSQTLECAVRTIRAPADFPQWGRDLSARLWLNETLPGGLAGYELTATVDGAPIESAGRVTEYRVVRPPSEPERQRVAQ